MSNPKIIKNGRMDIYPDTRPVPPPPTSHISDSVRAALKKQIPEIARHVREVADTK